MKCLLAKQFEELNKDFFFTDKMLDVKKLSDRRMSHVERDSREINISQTKFDTHLLLTEKKCW